MTDDAPKPGTPADPNQTVMRPRDPAPAVDNPDLAAPPPAPPGGASAASPPPPAGATAVGSTYGSRGLEPQPGTTGGAGPIDHDFPTKASRAGSTSAIVAVGTGLLAAAVVISAFRSRWEDGELDGTVYAAGLAATAALLLIGLVGAVVARRVTGGRAREEVVTWPGAVGILATGLMMAVGFDSDDHWVGYLIGAVIVLLSVVGYVASRRPAFVVTAIVGLGLIYALAFDDLLADRVGDDHGPVVFAAVVAVFVLVVTLLGWLLPSRAVSGVAVGAFGVAAFAGTLAALVAARYLFGAFGAMPGLGEAMSTDDGLGFEEADVWWIIAFAAVLTVVWALAASVSNHSGFAILAIAMPAVTVPLACLALAAEHPTRWSLVLGVAGGVLLLAALLLTRRRSRRLAEQYPG